MRRIISLLGITCLIPVFLTGVASAEPSAYEISKISEPEEVKIGNPERLPLWRLGVGLGGLILAVHGLLGEKKTVEWDVLVIEYISAGTVRIRNTYDDPNPDTTLQYCWFKTGTQGNMYYEYTYNHHKAERFHVNLLELAGGLVLMVWASQNTSERTDITFSLNKGSPTLIYQRKF